MRRQLGDLLPAEEAAEMANEDQHDGPCLPQRGDLDFASLRVEHANIVQRMAHGWLMDAQPVADTGSYLARLPSRLSSPSVAEILVQSPRGLAFSAYPD